MTRKSKKKLNNKAKLLITVVLMAICLFVLHKFDFFTKSAEVDTTGIKFIETETGTEIAYDLEYFQDENNNPFVILPESINGYYTSSFKITAENPIALFNNSLLEDEEQDEIDVESDSKEEVVPEDIVEETKDIPEENLEETTNTQKNNSNSNPNPNTNTINNNVVEEKTATNTVNENTIVENTTTNTTVNDSKNENNSNTIAQAKNISSLENISNEDTKVATMSLDNEDETNNIKNIANTNTITNSVENVVENNTVTNSVVNTIANTNTIEENITNSNFVLENNEKTNETPKIENDNQATEELPIMSTFSNNEIMTATIEDAVYRPGEKIYLDAETIENNSAMLEVTFDTKIVNGLTLYNRDINATREVTAGDTVTESYKVNLKGFIPRDYYLTMQTLSNSDVTEKIEGVEEFEGANVLVGFDLTITDGTNNFNPKDYQEYVIATITSDTHIKSKIDKASLQVLHFEETETEEKIEKIVVIEKTENSVKFTTDAFSEYAVLAYPAVLDDLVTIDDYESDYNFYMGKNYTDNTAGTYNATYTDNNLAKVNINYYSYDYSKNLNGNNDLQITNIGWANRGNQTSGNYRNYTVRLTINAPDGKTIDPEKSWVMELRSPSTEFSAAQTRTLNTGKLSAIAVDSANNITTITITGNDLSGWTETTAGSVYTVDLVFAFSNNTTVNMNSANNLSMTVNEKVFTGYISAKDTERQVLMSYIKCVPINSSGNVTVELIDNPYMDRPAGYGFDGWKTNESGYNFSINNDTKVQKVTVNTNGQKEITIDLYVNWAKANVIFVNGSNAGNNNNNGLTPDTAVRDWTGVTNRFNTNRKTATNASNRELNIVVLINGTLTGISNIQPGFTLTSLYDGEDHRNASTYLNLTGNVTLGNYDLQLDYLNISGSNNYTSTTTTSEISRTLYGNARNVRIGRGVTPLSTATAATTFGQIQGGPTSNTNINRSFRLVIESGKYANLHAVGTSTRSYTGTSTMVLGCDYDRINDFNEDLKLYNRGASRSGSGTIKTKDSGEPVHTIIIKSGSLGMDAFNSRAGDYEFSGIYIGGHSSGTDSNDRVMIVEGGNVANLLGGLAIQDSNTAVRTYIYMKGGHVQYIVGGAGVSTTRGQRTIQVTGGSVAYSVAGGSNGVTAGNSTSSNPTGRLDGNSLVYVGGNAVIGTELGNVLYDVEAGCVLGAGNGNNDPDVIETAGKVNYSHVIIDRDAQILNSVYGGGNYGVVGNSGAGLINSAELIPESVEYINHSNRLNTTEHYMITNTNADEGRFLLYNGTGLESGTYNAGSAPIGADDWIFETAPGGYYLKSVSENKYVTLSPNYTRERVRTGRNTYVDNAITGLSGFTATLTTQPSTVFITQVNGAAIRIYHSHTYNRYARSGTYFRESSTTGYGYLSFNTNTFFTTNATNVYLLKFQDLVNDGDETEVTERNDATTVAKVDIFGGTINQNVYGGVNMNHILGSVEIYMEDGVVEGAIYGGSNNSGTVDGASKITIKGGTLGKQTSSTDVLFGGGRGDQTRITQRTLLNITDEKKDLNMYGSIYGGSALGRVSASSTVNISDLTTNTNKILINGNVFGGGRGSTAIAALTGGKVTVNVDGGTYSNTSVFGGCNERGLILNSILVNIGQNYATRVANVYGGGNNAAIIGSTNSDYVYLHRNATVEKAFNGGNNAGIQSNNTITPRAIYAQGATVGELYGGSNNSGNLTQSFVYVSDGATITNVYGGGYGEGAQITGRATVNIQNSLVEDCVYGGGNAGAVGADTDVDIINSNIGNVYAGGKGNTADVGTNTVADITRTTVYGKVYGGGNDGAVLGYTDINLDNTNVGDSVYAGGQGEDAQVNLYTYLDVTDSYVTNNIYGGGNNGAVQGYTDINVITSETNYVYAGGQGETATVGGNTNATIDTSTIHKNVYGGGNAGEVIGNTNLEIISSEIQNSVYGGGKSASVATTDIDVEQSNVINNIYGGGEDGTVEKDNNEVSTSISIENTEVANVFGGGKGKDANVANSTSIEIKESTIKKSQDGQGNIYGGGDLGHVSGDTSITIEKTDIEDTVYGGGNSADIDGCTSVAIIESNVTGNVYGGGNAGEVAGTGNVGLNGQPASSTAVSIEGSIVNESVFGGGNAGEVLGNTYVMINHLVKADSSVVNTIITKNIYGGGNQADVGGTTVNMLNDSTATNVYGGGNLGEVKDSTNVIIDKSIVLNNAFGGGSGSSSDLNGILGQIINDTSIEVRNEANIKNDLFGGGDNGRVQGNSNVLITSSKIEGSAYAAGNGTSASVLKNSHIVSEGSTQIEKSIFGGGNAAVTGEVKSDGNGGKVYDALAIVDIAGAVIGKNVYGGANSSVINGNTITNIGIDAINDYHGEDKGYDIGKIEIGGTIFGGGESMDPEKEFSYTDISVEGTILINIDGQGYDTNDNTISFAESIFGSGNASSAAVNGDVNIRNYGTREKPKKGVSIQRAGTVIIDNSSLQLRGTTDSTSPLNPDGVFTFNIIEAIKSTNNSTLYLENGANLVGGYYSINGEVNDNPEYATVTIKDTVHGEDGKTYESINGKIYDGDEEKYYISAGVIYEPSEGLASEDTVVTNVASVEYATTIDRNVDNRIYAFSGRNVNISKSEDVLSLFGDVKGMSFFGIFNLDGSPTEENPENNLYMGMYDPDYDDGQDLTWKERDFNRTYVLGIHYNEHDITKDGFYTVYEKLRVELGDSEVLKEDNYLSYDPYSYTSYITPTPKEDAYYMWCAGPDEEVFYYPITLVASKYSSFGTKELALIGISAENAILTMTGFESALVDGVGLYDKNTIPNINSDRDAANNMYGLTMQTGNTGWSMTGKTDFYADAITEDNQERNSAYEGTQEYIIENQKTTPIFSFYLYHSNNITEARELGTCQVNMKLSYWKDSLSRGTGKIIIDVILMSEVYDNIGYNGAITPGSKYELFTNTVTNVTTKSSFSAYFEFAQEDFSTIEHVQRYYDQSYRVITTGYAFPEGTTITMIDRWNKNNPEYYYYIVTADDYSDGKTTYRFEEFMVMGSSSERYDEEKAREKYLIEDMDYQYENFIFIVNFENANFTDIPEDSSLITNNQEFNIYLNADYDGTTNALYYLLDEQMGSITYGIYDTESTIEVDADLSKNRIFLGNDVKLNVNTIYNVAKGEQGALVYDTRYFDKKLGIKITLFENIGDQDGDNIDDYDVVSGADLLGTYFELNNDRYFPRADGTTRIKIADLVSNASSSIKIRTENSSLATNDYLIKIESFGSADGIYYGVKASDETYVELEIINDLYGLNSTLPANQVIIDKTTGRTVNSEGLLTDENENKLEFDIEYLSGVNNPYITVSLYRRDYDENLENPYENTYTKVDFAEYVNETLELPKEINQAYDEADEEFIESIKEFEVEYTAIDTNTIKSVVPEEIPEENPSVTLNANYTLKEDLTSGTYKVVFSLYDVSDEVVYKQEYDNAGNLIGQKPFNIKEYMYIGDTFSYIIIK